MRISDWSSDVCSSDLEQELDGVGEGTGWCPPALSPSGERIAKLARGEPEHRALNQHHYPNPFVLSLSKHCPSSAAIERKNGPSTCSGQPVHIEPTPLSRSLERGKDRTSTRMNSRQ